MRVHIETNAEAFPGPLYLDASALAKSYIPEAESEMLGAFLRDRKDLVTSQLAVTEVTSALCRRRSEGHGSATDVTRVYRRLRHDIQEGSFFELADLTDAVHRESEAGLLASEGTPLRAGDALHLALAKASRCATMVTFDRRLAEASRRHGLAVYPETI